MFSLTKKKSYCSDFLDAAALALRSDSIVANEVYPRCDYC